MVLVYTSFAVVVEVLAVDEVNAGLPGAATIIRRGRAARLTRRAGPPIRAVRPGGVTEKRGCLVGIWR
jgi:hypothetical protein